MPAARRELELFPPTRRKLTHAGPWPHANPGRRLQLCQSRRQQRRKADALVAVPATQLKARRKRSRVRRSLMHEWKYQEAAAERLSPGAVQRLRARFAAVLHGDGTVPSDGRRGGAGAARSVETGWLQSDKLESLWREAVAESQSQSRYEGGLWERGSGNAPHVPQPQPRRRDADADDGGDGGDGGGDGGDGGGDSGGGDGGDGGGDSGDGGGDSEAGLAEQPPTAPFSEPRGSSTPFSEHAATDRELLTGWLGRLSKGP